MYVKMEFFFLKLLNFNILMKLKKIQFSEQ